MNDSKVCDFLLTLRLTRKVSLFYPQRAIHGERCPPFEKSDLKQNYKMNNELIEQKSWWKRNWKWFVPVCGIILISITVFLFSGMGGITTDFAKAYADTELYENALKKVNANEKVNELLGEIEPLGKLAILEGQIEYSNDNQKVKSTVRIIGTKGKARMDITADRINDIWNYSKINVRIKNPPEKKQTIEINTAE